MRILYWIKWEANWDWASGIGHLGFFLSFFFSPLSFVTVNTSMASFLFLFKMPESLQLSSFYVFFSLLLLTLGI